MAINDNKIITLNQEERQASFVQKTFDNSDWEWNMNILTDIIPDKVSPYRIILSVTALHPPIEGFWFYLNDDIMPIILEDEGLDWNWEELGPLNSLKFIEPRNFDMIDFQCFITICYYDYNV